MSSFWDSVADLRQIEYVLLLIMMVTSVLCGGVILSIRHRVKILQMRSLQSQGYSYSEHVQKLETQKRELESHLETTRKNLHSLRSITAPREITPIQEDIILEKLRGIKAAPVIVSAYSFEDESAAYGEQIAAALKKAGWQVTFNRSSMNDFKGISLGTVNLMRRPLSGLHELAEALAAAHLELHEREIAPDTIAGSLQDGSLLVVVGRK